MMTGVRTSWLAWLRATAAALALEACGGHAVDLDRPTGVAETAADILAKTPERFDRALSGAQNATEKTELDRRMAQLEEVIRLAAQGRSS